MLALFVGKMRRIVKYIIMLVIFGLVYFTIECIWKGHLTDWRMAVLGAFLGLFIGMINNAFSFESDVLLQGIVGSLIITVAEAVGGYQWNTIEGRNIWDYSKLPLSGVDGNVSAIFSVFLWIPLSWFAIILDDSIRYYVFKESNEQPYYKIFGKLILRLPKRR